MACMDGTHLLLLMSRKSGDPFETVLIFVFQTLPKKVLSSHRRLSCLVIWEKKTENRAGFFSAGRREKKGSRSSITVPTPSASMSFTLHAGTLHPGDTKPKEQKTSLLELSGQCRDPQGDGTARSPLYRQRVNAAGRYLAWNTYRVCCWDLPPNQD